MKKAIKKARALCSKHTMIYPFGLKKQIKRLFQMLSSKSINQNWNVNA